MLGSGFGLYAVEAFKRDKKRRKQHTPFSTHLLRFEGKKIIKEFPKATKKQLMVIQEKIKKQERKERNKLILAFALAIPVTIVIIMTIVNSVTH
ncbi:hypothetical protein U8527_15165 [Kordia algicida OT-1]|uniref:Uncharacterized protein n=1 Tax=Kordia algicida OT-1 TaxID=391587 RepID=A9E7E2_9FLAO|nr:hypothetical protein [Kordia algicida]EDP94893.1 hypothetical protein KAOT1_08769 [Kordia algicida OT-1]